MTDITPKEANEILSHYTDLGYGVVIEGEDTSKIKQALSLARKTLENGIPYNPTGDLISREALKKELQENGWITDDPYGESGGLEEIIDNAPTVLDRPQGKWKTVEGVDGDEYYECSNCGEPWVLTAGTPEENNMNFCPNCGADMRKGKKNEQSEDNI